MWSYHLGFKGTWAHDKRSVAIETVNIGPLVRKGDDLYCWPNNFTQKYCNLKDTDKYVDLGQSPYRGYGYFAAFTKKQLEVIPELVSSIADQFKIPKAIPPKELRGAYNIEQFTGWHGIWDHAACRSDKFDIGPAFDWSMLEKI
jgi:N-acetyl-anhydromuramyl-L-alanine amidase AmpD